MLCIRDPECNTVELKGMSSSGDRRLPDAVGARAWRGVIDKGRRSRLRTFAAASRFAAHSPLNEICRKSPYASLRMPNTFIR